MSPRALLLAAVKAVHSLIFFTIEIAIGYVLYAGLRGRSDRRAAVTGGIVAAECAIYAANGFRCPLTGVAERIGAERGSVTDIYLPGWLARNVARIHVPLVVWAAYLHARNLKRSRAPR